MKLNVIETEMPWYADGLRFTCSQCGNCCTGGPGYVFMSDVEIDRMAEFLKIPREELIDKYCRRIGSKISLKEKRGRGGYDCIFLEEIESTTRPAGADRDVKAFKRICQVYSVRPLQCRTWPFWPENLASEKAWEGASQRCPGINAGSRTFTRERIEEIRDSEDWPAKPPSSG